MGTSRVREVVIDPNFAVPTGVVDARQRNDEEGAIYYEEDDIAEEGTILQTVDFKVPMPPTSYKVIEQRVRIGADGRSVVDIYIDFPDTKGIESIGVRVTPA